MKKSIIKRRKRVIPVTQGPESADENLSLAESAESPHLVAEDSIERGTINEDGSVNLGPRRHPEQSLPLLPEPRLQRNRQASPLPTGDLMQYHAASSSKGREIPLESLNDDNRLAPITGMNTTVDRQPSLSPASFLSPTRKRSFSATESEEASPRDESSKRVSSIKSILNSSAGIEPTGEQRKSADSSQGGGVATAIPGSGTPVAVGSADARVGEERGESEVSKAERRAALQREADRMRELLAAKERELAELGPD